MQRALFNSFIMLVLVFPFCETSTAHALITPHPLMDYERGITTLNAYRGDPQTLSQAQQIFTQIIEKHPDSPFGYLGMSQLKTVDAYRYGQHYDIKILTNEAMPMALKAMRMGPTLVSVHQNYDRFEAIFKNNEETQDYVRRLLFLFPERAHTYLTLGDYLTDQGEIEEALEYYKVSLRFAETDQEKLKALLRIAHIYLKDLYDCQNAATYYESALSINPDLPVVREYLGKAYLDLKQYDQSVLNLQKAFDVFQTPQIESWLMEAKRLLYEENGDLDKAITEITQALINNNQNSALHRQLAILYYKKSDFKKAMTHFKKVIDAGRVDAETYYYAGRSAHQIGEESEARGYYQQYLYLQSEGQQAEWIRQNIPDLSHR